MDCHLMVAEPERYVHRAIKAGAKYVSIHIEATRHVQHRLQQIRNADDMRRILAESDYADVDVRVDGNVTFHNIPLMAAVGATMPVGGTRSIFQKDYSTPLAVTEVRKLLQNTGRAQ